MDNTELTHHGVKGMRWGVRRFQNKDGSLTGAGKKRYGDKPPGVKAKTGTAVKKKKLTRPQKKALEKARAAREAKRKEAEKNKEFEAERQKAIASGSAKDILKFQGKLTQQEMQQVSQRIKWEQEMKNIADSEVSPGRAKADKMFKDMETYTNYAVTGAKAYNMAANVYNAFNGGKKLLPKIDTDIIKGNRNQRMAEEKTRKKEEAEAKAAKKIEDAAAAKEAEAARAAKKAEKEASKAEKAANKEAAAAAKNAKKEAAKSENEARKAQRQANKEAVRDISERTDYWTEHTRRTVDAMNMPISIARESKDTTIYQGQREVSGVLSSGGNKTTSDVPSSTIALGERRVAGLLPAPKEED